MGPPRVSFIISVRNAAEYLAAQLESLRRQTFQDFEVVLFDDGSTDHTVALAEAWAKKFDGPTFRIEQRAAGNYVDRFNEAIAVARGELLARADGDDITLPTRLERQVAFLDANPEVVAVGSTMLEVDPYDVPLGETDHATDHDEIERRLLLGSGWSMPHPVVTMRRSACEQVGLYRPEMKAAEDLDLFLRLAMVGKLANLPEPLVRYRRHLKSVNSTHVEQQKRAIRQSVDEALVARGRQPGAALEERSEQAPADKLENWVWNALRHHRPDAAKKHAWHRLKLRPTDKLSWKLLACAVRGK
jgi:glycosyltransferase involved in cell wall biosynthesis